MPNIIKRSRESLGIWLDFFRVYGYVFLPSITLVLGGLVTFVRPDLLTLVIATFFVTLGGSLACLTWKIIVIKERAQDLIEKFDGRILVHGVRMQGMDDSKDIIDPNDDPSSQMMH